MKIDKGSESGITCKSKCLFESKIFPLHGAFLLNVKWFGYKIGIQFNNNPLVAEQKSDAIKTVNAYVVFDLSQWPRNLLNNVVLKIWLFGANNIVKI